MMRRGRFISFEGVEGSGKSTLCSGIATALRATGREVLQLREPGGTELGEAVRSVVLQERKGAVDPLAELYLMLAARAQLCGERIRPALHEGKWVLCDRFMDASVAYQGYARGLGPELVIDLNAKTTQDLVPDRTLLVDLDPAEGLRRQTGAADRLGQEAEHFHRNVRQGYLEIARENPERVVVLDGGLGIQELRAAAWRALRELDRGLPESAFETES
jgi:dTMP kinase